MKRSYTKPVICMEKFQLNAAVAVSCSAQKFTPIHHSQDTCDYDHGQFYDFFRCQVDLTDDSGDGNDSICYHGPIASHGMIFTWS